MPDITNGIISTSLVAAKNKKMYAKKILPLSYFTCHRSKPLGLPTADTNQGDQLQVSADTAAQRDTFVARTLWK